MWQQPTGSTQLFYAGRDVKRNAASDLLDLLAAFRFTGYGYG